MRNQLADLPVQTIMTRWSATIGVFADWRTHCVGCPTAGFHYIADTALEQGFAAQELEQALLLAIDSALSPEARARSRPRSAAGGADP